MISFSSFGHKNITAKHKNTLEFTKEPNITLNGDCIIGVNSDFDLEKIKTYIKGKKTIKLTISLGNIKEQITFQTNPDFNDDNEIVIRKSNFSSKRTLGIYADKSCSDLSKELKDRLKDPSTKINITIE